ncbi:MAG: ABC transporter ATP-binding protein [Gammaproteobacteria bacterium]|nr:ABC transporter ATP-binding protein [Gammaproteobacteria bacterium]
MTGGEPSADTAALRPLLEVSELRVAFRAERHTLTEAVKGVSFAVGGQSTVALVGESGSGKSVSAMSIVRLLPENAEIAPGSRIVYGGQDLLAATPAAMRNLRGRDIAVIFQEPMTSLNPVFTIGDQIAEALRRHVRLGARAAAARAVELLDEVGIPRPAQRVRSYPHEMSGGQQQRAMIAMAIACEPRLLIADEPTTALDVTIQRQIIELLARLREKHQMSMLFITHDLGLVGEIADDVVVMQSGEVREQGTAREIFETPRHPYTRALLACRPTLDHRPARLAVIADFVDGRQPPALSDAPRSVNGHDPVVLEVRNLRKVFCMKKGLFSHEAVAAVDGVSFTLRRGHTLGVVGESGSGKTTVGLTVMRLHEASGGEVRFEGTDLLALSDAQMQPYRRRIQIVFQNPYASLNPRFTVGHILLEPMAIHGIGSGTPERLAIARQLLRRVGLAEDALGRYPHEFSGGQRQRIAIARCLTLKPDVLICDESVSALDVSVQAQVLNLLQDLQDELALSYIFISHDLTVVKYMSDEVLVMSGGRCVELASADEIYRAPRDEYTRRLLGSIPQGWRTKTGV